MPFAASTYNYSIARNYPVNPLNSEPITNFCCDANDGTFTVLTDLVAILTAQENECGGCYSGLVLS